MEQEGMGTAMRSETAVEMFSAVDLLLAALQEAATLRSPSEIGAAVMACVLRDSAPPAAWETELRDAMYVLNRCVNLVYAASEEPGRNERNV